MKTRCLMILGISFLLIGFVYVAPIVQASSSTSIEFVVLDEKEQDDIQEIDKKPLEDNSKGSSNTVYKKQNSGVLPKTNDHIDFGLLSIGIGFCLAACLLKRNLKKVH